jgi:hypothetical protein
MTYLDTWYIATGFMIFCAGYHVNEVSVDLAVRRIRIGLIYAIK